MKVLVFHIGPDRYGLPLAEVARVLPAATLKSVPLAPPSVAGILDLHGAPVPVLDLSRLAGQPRDTVYFDTRIVLVQERGRPLGLLAEHVSGIAAIDDAALRDAGVAAAPFLGKVVSMEGGMLQMVHTAQLLTPRLRELLYPEEGAPA